MAERPDTVRIWGSQLSQNDFPPVCALSGRPAEVWRKFTFRTPPAWTYALVVLVCLGLLGIIVFAVIVNAVALKASGHLPLTRASRRTVNLVTWVPAGLIVGPIAVVTVVAVAAAAGVDAGDANAGSLGATLVLLSIFALVLGLIGRLLIGPFILIRGKVEPVPGYPDRIVVLRRVSPAFAAAVRERQQAQMSASGAAPAQPPFPADAK